jgi:hypothetical protein
MVKIYAASQTPRIYGSGAGTLDITPFLLFDETLPAIASPTTLGYGEHVELTSPVTVGLPSPRKGAKLVIRNMSGDYSSVAAGAILYKGSTYTSLDFDTNTVALLKVVDGVWTASFVTESFAPIVATGGTVTEFTDPETGITYRVHSFTSVGSSTFTVSSLGNTSGEVEYLVVAGGGGGSMGGGGAGGYRCSVAGEFSGGGQSAETPLILPIGTISVLVGDGGEPGLNARNYAGQDGEDSTLHNIISQGGGGGGAYGDGGAAVRFGRNGGSGGGGGGLYTNQANAAGGTGATGQGLGGGRSSGTVNDLAGGGGGAAEAGYNGSGTALNGKGGDGVESFIDGTATYRAGGGGGGKLFGTITFGGLGGGGDQFQPGGNNTGGGGGGTNGVGSTRGLGKKGGSGIIIVRYAIAYP